MATAGTGGPSFEAPHNDIHLQSTCSEGSMVPIDISAYDPLL